MAEKRKKKFNAPKAKRKLDRLFSELILSRDGRVCRWCGQSSRDVKVWEEQIAAAKEHLTHLENKPPAKTTKFPEWKKRIAKQKLRLAKLIAKNGEVFKMDNSHIIPREVLITRWNPKNSICLCFSCHKAHNGRSWHSNPLWAIKWLRSHVGDAYCEELLEKFQQPYEFTEAEFVRIEAELKAELARLSPSQPATDSHVSSSPPVSTLPRPAASQLDS